MKTNRVFLSMLCASAMLSSSVLAEDKVLNIYNWSDYIGPGTVKKFEKETGTAVTPMLNPEVANNPGIYPPKAIKDKLFIQVAHTPKFDRYLTRTWSDIKTGR